MFSLENTLGLLQIDFGSYGVNTGSLIGEKLEKHGYEAEYSLVSKKITVLHSSDLSSTVLHSILYEFNNYEGWQPVVAEERNEQGDLQIRLTNRPFPKSETWLLKSGTKVHRVKAYNHDAPTGSQVRNLRSVHLLGKHSKSSSLDL